MMASQWSFIFKERISLLVLGKVYHAYLSTISHWFLAIFILNSKRPIVMLCHNPIIYVHRLGLEHMLTVHPILLLAASATMVRLLPKYTIKFSDIFFDHVDLVPQHVGWFLTILFAALGAWGF